MPLRITQHVDNNLDWVEPLIECPRPLLNKLISVLPSNLTCLNLEGAHCTDATFTLLSRNGPLANSLRHLNLQINDITDRSASLWRKFQSLESLCLFQSRHLGESTYKAISRLPLLESLELDGRECDLLAMVSILFHGESLPRLRSLRIEGGDADDEDFVASVIPLLELRANRELLEVVSFGLTPFEPAFRPFFELLPRLVESPFSFADLNHIEQLGPTGVENFSTIALNSLTLTAEQIRRVLLSMPLLTSLTLADISFGAFEDEADLAVFRSSASLQSLLFDKCRSVPGGLRFPSSLSSLKYVASSLTPINSLTVPQSEDQQLLNASGLVQILVNDLGDSLTTLHILEMSNFPAQPLDAVYNRLHNLQNVSFSWVGEGYFVDTRRISPPKLQSVEFSNKSSDFLPIFQRAPELFSLRITEDSANASTAESLRSLTSQSTPSLKRLMLETTIPFKEQSLHSSFIDSLLGLDSLEVLWSRHLIAAEDLPRLTALSRLHSLILYNTPSIDIISCSGVFRHLLSLSLAWCGLHNFDSIAPLPWLQHLSMASVNFGSCKRLLFSRTHFPNLQTLSLQSVSHLKVQAVRLPVLTQIRMTHLESVRIEVSQCSSLVEASFNTLHRCPEFSLEDNLKLSKLAIHYTKFWPDTMVSVLCPSIQIFSFTDAGERSEIMRDLCRSISSGKHFKHLKCTDEFYLEPADAPPQ
jgi:hypothetical protein